MGLFALIKLFVTKKKLYTHQEKRDNRVISPNFSNTSRLDVVNVILP